MSYEINIISVAQEAPVSYIGDSSVLLRDEQTCEEVARYYKIWPVFSNTKGILYNVVTEMECGFYSSFPICDSDFRVHLANTFSAFSSIEVAENLTPLIINDTFLTDLQSIVSLLIETSPARTILFQTRYEGGDFEVIQGTFEKSVFLKMLEERKVMFNVCYAVTADSVSSLKYSNNN